MAPSELRYDGQTVVVTGAGGGLGKAYAVFYGSRGANVVVNDLGGSFKGEGGSSKAADVVVDEIKAAGGKAVANYDSVENGDNIINTAIKAFGRVDVLINNAGILRDISFKNMTDKDWDLIMAVHLRGSYKCAKAAWPHFRKQQFGRVINTASASGLFGSFGQANYSAAKLALVGFTETLAKEGAKYNILCNAIAPIAASRMTATIMPEEVLKALKPEFIVPLVAVLTHKDSDENGSIYEAGAGHMAKYRWESAKGALLKADATMTPGGVLAKWNEVNDFSEVEHRSGPANFIELLEQAGEIKSNPKVDEPTFKDKVVVITGAGGGLGRAYALLFAKHGAKVVVNDLVNPDGVVEEIRKSGGQAAPSKASAEDGDAVIKHALDAFGAVHILVNNAGILRDKAFANMDDSLWDSVVNVHLRGTYKCTKAAWPHFLKQKYGRIINTTSTSGIYGNFGQANYAAAKCGILGFSRALALEGKKYNIYVNTIAPNAGTNMTRTIMPEELVQAFKPDYVAPLVVALSSDNVPEDPEPGPTGGLYECGSGWQAQTRWQRSNGFAFPVNKDLTPEEVLSKWETINDFDAEGSDHPYSGQEASMKVMGNISVGDDGEEGEAEGEGEAAEDYNKNIAAAKEAKAEPSDFSYTEKDVILYNLGLGAKSKQLPLVYENSDDFQVLPTFGVIPPFNSVAPYSFSDIMPNFSPMMLLHGEQYLEIRKFPIPTEADLVSYPHLVEVQDKGAAAVAVQGTITKDKNTGEDVFYNESTIFVRGSGGFNGPSKGKDRGPASRAYKPPQRKPDAVEEEKTTEEQAALYRLSGDRNPLHIDPSFSKVGGFKEPILHGLCSFGIAGKAVLKHFGYYRNIKVRFAGTVVPGQTLRTEMWKEGKVVIFQTTVVETGKPAISGAGAELLEGAEKAKL